MTVFIIAIDPGTVYNGIAFGEGGSTPQFGEIANGSLFNAEKFGSILRASDTITSLSIALRKFRTRFSERAIVRTVIEHHNQKDFLIRDNSEYLHPLYRAQRLWEKWIEEEYLPEFHFKEYSSHYASPESWHGQVLKGVTAIPSEYCHAPRVKRKAFSFVKERYGLELRENHACDAICIFSYFEEYLARHNVR